MSICNSGMDCKLSKTVSVVIEVKLSHSLMKLMNTIDWTQLSKLIIPDLKKSTSKLKWWLGRKLKLRTHLGIYLLQQLLNETDRGIEHQVHDNAVYAIFCGKLFVHNWTVPDHTKIEEFRSRLSPETQCTLSNEITRLAARKGFARPEHIDIDSTIQAPDMQYPATINLLLKTAIVGRHIQKILKRMIPDVVKDHIPEIDMKMIKGLARQHYFEKRKALKQRRELRKEALAILWKHVTKAVDPVVRFARIIAEPFILESLPKRDKNLITHFVRKAPAILTELFERCYENALRKAKTFSYNRDAVACFNKGKHHKPLEFGRQFQIGRVGGNFVYSIPNDSISMPDAASVKKMMIQHIELFQTPIESIGADKGYYSKENERLALSFKINAVALQRPVRKLKDPPDNPITPEQLRLLENRRAGIEPIIGHLKKYWQMDRSRMKSDRTTESSGFASMLGFNIRQMVRYLNGDVTLVSPT